MFNLFKKKEVIPQELKEFADKFSNGQKSAIIVSLVLIVQSSSKSSREEMEIIGRTGRLLEVEDTSPSYSRVSQLDLDSITRILDTLNIDQKRWFVMTVYSMLKASDSNEDKVKAAVTITEGMGIDEDKLIEIVTNTTAFTNALFGPK